MMSDFRGGGAQKNWTSFMHDPLAVLRIIFYFIRIKFVTKQYLFALIVLCIVYNLTDQNYHILKKISTRKFA